MFLVFLIILSLTLLADLTILKGMNLKYHLIALYLWQIYVR